MDKFNKITEVQQAILRDDKKYHGIPLPSPQRSGTSFQNETYAFNKAQDIVESFYR